MIFSLVHIVEFREPKLYDLKGIIIVRSDRGMYNNYQEARLVE